uniref:PKD domain-containing protein n=1 Tax=Arthrobacter castelli TaxID=271431 RepID=UPI0006848399
MKRFWAYLFSLLVVLGMGLTVPSQAMASDVSYDEVVSDAPVGFTPNVLDGIVFSIAEVGDLIVLGGSFTEVQASDGGQVLNRNGVVAFNRNNGNISSDFAPQFNSTVRSVVPAADGQSVYIGGQFGTMNGASVPKVVQVSINTGNRVASFAPGPIDAVVHDMKLVDDRLFIGGNFTSIGGVNRSSLAELDPDTGQLRDSVDLSFQGTHRGGWTFVHKFDVTPDGNTMVVTGNFTSIDGQDRVQIGVIDVSGPTAELTDWRTDRWQPNCYASFAYYLNDLDISPDGSYFVLGSMGGYGSGPPSLCDSVSKWQLGESGTGVDPIWVDYTGGDSVYALEATGEVVYYGGHSRWANNPFAGDRVGPGAVDREGIGALHALNGLPVDWNPGRARGRGVFDLLATPQGLWVGSDTDRIARYLYRARIAMFPLAGGSGIPTASPPALPVDVIQTGSRDGQVDERYLYRINAGGPTVPSIDGGMDWLSDGSPPGSDYRNTGNAAASSGVTSVTDAVPVATPLGVFATERWDPTSSPEKAWSFPVDSGSNVQLRLYLADTCSCTSEPGSRVFSIRIEGETEYENLDLNASVGHRVGTVLSQDIVSDGSIDIEFLHGVENPTVNAIEIVDMDAPAPDPGQTDQAQQRFFDGDQAAEAEPLTLTGDVPWDSVRGGFIADDSLYLAMVSGEFHRRPLDGNAIGDATELDLHGLTGFAAEMQQMTGLFYSEGRIYFTLAGQSELFMRYFELDSGIVGAQRFAVSDPTGLVDWSGTRGLFLAGETVYWATADSNLHAIQWNDEGMGDGTVSGTPEVVSGPDQDSANWASRSLIAMEGTAPPPPNEPPTAEFTAQCNALDCEFDGSGSSDPDGSIDSYGWTVDGAAASDQATLSRTFSSPGTYSVTLTVTDDDGASDSTTQEVVVEAPPNESPTAAFTDACDGLECVFDGSGSSDPDGTVDSYAWTSSDGGTGDQSVFNHTFAEAGTYDVTLTVTDDDGESTELVRQIMVTSDPAPVNEPPVAEFVDSCEFLSCTFDASGSSD